MRRVIVESPYRGKTDEETKRNIIYAQRCLHDCFMRDEAPFASHLLYTQPGVLNDKIPKERKYGIEAGFVWRDASDVTVVYTDYGISEGMRHGIANALAKNKPVEYREIGKNP